MNREQAETLLAALVADELDEPTRGELLAYLKNDPELTERLGDMRLAAGLLREGLEEASADMPTALADAQRAELLALIEREPIMAIAQSDEDESGAIRGPLFSIRFAGAVAACAALGVGLVGILLPELGDERRSARRMQNDQEAAAYAYGDAAEAPFYYDEVPRAELSDSPRPPYESGTLGISPADSLDYAAGTRVRNDKVVRSDGQAGDLLNASSGTLALSDTRRDGKDFSSYSTLDGTRHTATQFSHAPQINPGIANVNPSAAPVVDPALLPTDRNLYRSADIGDANGGQGGGATGMDGLLGDLPQIAAKPGDVVVPGAVPSTGDWAGSTLWNDNHTGYDRIEAFDSRSANGRADLDGKQVPQTRYGKPTIAEGETTELRWESGQQGQQNASPNGVVTGLQITGRSVTRGKDQFSDDALAADLSLGARTIGKQAPPGEGIAPSVNEPTRPGERDALSFSIDLPMDSGFLQALDDTQSNLTQAQRELSRLTVDRNAAAMQIGAAESQAKREQVDKLNTMIEEQLGTISELQSQRSDLAQALIDERVKMRRLSDNYSRTKEEDRTQVPQFGQAPAFDLDHALANSSSGGGSDKQAPLSDLMSQARANTSADKAEQGDESLRKGQLKSAVQFYEDATLLNPDNVAYREKLAEAKEKLDEQMRPLGGLDQTATDRSVDRRAVIAEYEKAMAKATAGLEKQDYQAANNAVIEARTILSRDRQTLDTDDYNDRVSRANQLQGLTQATQARTEAEQMRSIELERNAISSKVASETEKRKIEAVQKHLRKARALQLEQNYDQALVELEAAQFLDPDNPVVGALRGMVTDTAAAAESFKLKRNRDLEIAGLTLKNLEATTPYADILTYPGDWPELTQLRLEGLEAGKDADERIPDAIPIEPLPEPEPTPEVVAEEQARVAPPVNPWVLTAQDAQSTFALDTDTASYELARRTIREQAQLPAVASVRLEEFVNRFDYQYPAGRDAHDTFTVHTEAGPAPFAGRNGGEAVLLKVGVRGRVVARDQMKPAHYVFVIDASGSMAREDRLPLVQQSLAMLLGQLGESDTVSLVSYETRPYLLIQHASASDAQSIIRAAATIQTGGSTNLTDGLKLGYQIAGKHFKPGGVNRVILCSDGVANVGDDDAKAMLDAVDTYRRHGVTLMTVGVGVDGQAAGQAPAGAERFNDGLMEQLANRGDGQYVYLGSADDAQRQFVQDLAATRPTIAYDAKIQVAFDPLIVRRYRLIGYENRDIADRDFRNDAVDAGEVGSGQSATALYEVELWPTHRRRPAIAAKDHQGTDRLATVYVRYRDAQSNKVQETATAVARSAVRDRAIAEAPRFYLAACAAEFAELLRESEHAADGSYARLHRIAQAVAEALPLDKDAAELAELIGRAQGLPRAGQ